MRWSPLKVSLTTAVEISHTTWRGVRLMRESCGFSGNISRKIYFSDLKPNCAHPCQESIEMVWLRLFVTNRFSVMSGEQLIRFT